MSDELWDGAGVRNSVAPGWTTTELGELLEPCGLSYGIVQPGPDTADGIPILRVKNLRSSGVDTSEVMRVSQSVEAAYQRTRLRGGEILLSLVGSVGEVAIAPSEVAGWNVARAIGVLRPSNEASASWIRLCLMTEEARHCIRSWQNETVQATLNLRDVRRLPIVMPPHQVREAITGLVGALDDKIAANDQIAVTAEALMRACFESISNSSVEEISIGALGRQILDTVGVFALNPTEPYIGLEHMPRRSVWLDSWAAADGVASAKSRFIEGDVLFGKLRPYFHKVGLAQTSGVCSTDIIVIRPAYFQYRLWLLLAASSDDVVAFATAHSDGTRMPRARWSDLASCRVARPTEGRLASFNDFAQPLVSRVNAAMGEKRLLRELRDTLLPKLISGEIRIKDAERQVSAAV